MTAFPRSVFSESELDATRWFASKCGVQDLPPIRQVKRHRSKILDLCGANLKSVNGRLGNTFAILDLGKILADEFANPLVRPFIRTLSEDSGELLREACQAGKWRTDVSPNLSGPMVRHEGQDFYVNEPALAYIGPEGGADCAAVLPSRWFTRDGVIWAKVQRLRSHPDPEKDCLLIDSRSSECEELPLSRFFASFPKLESYVTQGSNWTLEDVSITPCEIEVPNPLRTLAAGRRVLVAPLWSYCDDTSGNVSKKWNKHNSILMYLAGLDPKKAHLLYNVIFLATSNLAHPLEMFDSVVEFLNEFASHIGLTGKCFCRVCHVRGADSKKRPAGAEGDRERVAEFLSVPKAGSSRSKDDTLTKLRDQLDRYLRGAPSTAATEATETGVKDKYFQHFGDKLAEACANIKEKRGADPTIQGQAYPAQVLADLRAQMPLDDAIFSPALRLDDFDPTTDSPVEILHVVLLGFVKYFWRDAVSRQKPEGKEILKARINSFDTAPLGLAKARGHTLVQYAGSLTGRDFRLIAQIAPAVLYGLIPDEAYEAWLALCRLTPLVFQPEIPNLTSYLTKLQGAVDDFLAATALWNTQWFNKPKFHILSYNYVIRARSVHSNRQAPSLDIGQAFSHMHAVRHLISGGWIVLDPSKIRSPEVRQAGSAVRNLVKDPVFVQSMGMAEFFSSTQAVIPRWSNTEANIYNIAPPSQLNSDSVLRKCNKVVLLGGDIAHVGGFVLFRKPTDAVSQRPRIGKVLEIVADEFAGTLLGILVCEYTVGETGIAPYRFPSLTSQPDRIEWCSLKACVATASTIHNCAAHGCTPTATKSIIQERKATGRFEKEVVHSASPDDVLFNLAQLRSAQYIQKFQPSERYPDLDRPGTTAPRIVMQSRTLRPGHRCQTSPSTIYRQHARGTRGRGRGHPRKRAGSETRSQSPALPKTPRIQQERVHQEFSQGPANPPFLRQPEPEFFNTFHTMPHAQHSLSNRGPQWNWTYDPAQAVHNAQPSNSAHTPQYFHQLPGADSSTYSSGYGYPPYNGDQQGTGGGYSHYSPNPGQNESPYYYPAGGNSGYNDSRFN
ncbi:hypothetical protein C8R45DRAFT_1147453 [Mycena sanguinolenta]|nr:hypothetical protein C8R45DRAFT_1147453 [Mycena sanguinolenta]